MNSLHSKSYYIGGMFLSNWSRCVYASLIKFSIGSFNDVLIGIIIFCNSLINLHDAWPLAGMLNLLHSSYDVRL